MEVHKKNVTQGGDGGQRALLGEQRLLGKINECLEEQMEDRIICLRRSELYLGKDL